MKKKVVFFLIVFIGAFLFFLPKLKLIYRYYINPCYYDTPIKQQDFPQEFIEVNLDAYYSEIVTLAEPNFKVDTLETIQYKEKSYPILSLAKKETNTTMDKRLLIVSGVHGNESGGTLAVLELLKEYHKNPNRFDGWDVQILTPVNPAGTIEMSRYNECGCDLNRKIKSSKQKGIVVQKNLVDSFKPNVIVGMHEAPSAGFLIHSNQYLKEELLLKLLKDTEGQGIALATKDYLGRDLAIAGNSKIEGFLKFLNGLLQVQALGDYASEKEIIEITTESGWNSKDKFQRVNSHAFLILSLIDNYE